MEAILNVIAGLGLIGSLALFAWGMALCLRHGLFGETVDRSARGLGAAGPIGRAFGTEG